MRLTTTLALLMSFVLAKAQTIYTVQNGAWTNPATWSCNCVPAPGSSLVIMHSVDPLGNLTFSFPQVQVTSAGEIYSSILGDYLFGGTFIIEGHVFLVGNIVNAGGTIDVSGFFEMAGIFSSDGDIIMDGGVMQVEGDFYNYLSVSGTGSICVIDSTYNQGNIQGTLDFCDWTPTVSSPPYLDQNVGTVATTVTFCTNSACFSGIDDAVPFANTTIFPDPAHDFATLNNITKSTMITLFDALGQQVPVATTRDATSATLQLSGLAPATYFVRLSSANAQRTLPLVVE